MEPSGQLFSSCGGTNSGVADKPRHRGGSRLERICVDNGPEFVSKALDAWCYAQGVQLVFSPGKPTDNPFIEAFNSRFRDECLDQHWFASREEARQTIEAWRREYNTERPHQSLGQQTPAIAAAAWEEPPDSLREATG